MELLQALYRIAAPSGNEKAMLRFLEERLKSICGVRYDIDTMGNIYVVKGNAETYPCMVAHTDEVHRRPKTGYEVISVHDAIVLGYNSTLGTFSGIGADDKNGIWVALKCLEKYDVLKCAFFVQEERGWIGSYRADMDFFKDCRFVLQCDRKGNSDLIVSINGMTLCSKQFIKATEYKKFGYKRATGLISDVAALKQNGLGISCVNISCGYYEPHTDREYTVIADLYKCLDFVQHIVETCTEVYTHVYKAPKQHRFAGVYDWGGFDDDLFEPHYIRRPVHSKPANNPQSGYCAMLERMTQMVDADPSLGLAAIAARLNREFPMMRYSDFSMAYSDIMGKQSLTPATERH